MYAMVRKNVYRLTLVVVVLFVFFAPVIPTTAPLFWLLPWYHHCYGLSRPGYTTVYASISAIGFGMLLPGGEGFDSGLVYVPDNGWNTLQFPPFGFGHVICE
jgi:hypothetical protein